MQPTRFCGIAAKNIRQSRQQWFGPRALRQKRWTAEGAVHAVAAPTSDRGRHSAVAARYVVRADDSPPVADHAILAFCSMCKSHTMSVRQNALRLEQLSGVRLSLFVHVDFSCFTAMFLVVLFSASSIPNVVSVYTSSFALAFAWAAITPFRSSYTFLSSISILS